ncbi:CAP domain-containing protein [Virgibacillus litoralis]|uniref:YkwD family protein n=1 Tax=Virgibacillus litoralis TaxID=578221 RepID=A0ABS4HBN8_9BACI|nr:CAP domain-containing protein [Virgibacillus litoralis]MBP1948320.1 putative YkwD family protein [Virgibacillus litoralis]
MLRWLFVFVAILFMVSIQTPDTVQKTWKADKIEPATFDKWTVDIKEWLADNDISVARIKDNLTQLVSVPRGGDTVPNSSSEQGAPSNLEAKDPSDFEKEVVDLVNQERVKENLEPLKMHDRLSSLARKKSEDMAKNNYFSHTSPTYGSPFDMMQQFNFNYSMAGENIAAGQRSPEQVVEGWMNSEGHRKNIMKDGFTHIGVGYVEGAGLPYKTYWTQLFMTPR